MICTDKYVAKANSGQGGVGYEKMIITSNLIKKIDENKIIPIIRQNGTTDVPTFLKSKLYINFSKSDDFEYSYDELVRTIHSSPLFEKPPVGNNPFQVIKKEQLDGDLEIVHKILKMLVSNYNSASFDFRYLTIDALIGQLQISRIFIEIIVSKIINMGYAKWKFTNHSFEITEKGKVYAFENKFHD